MSAQKPNKQRPANSTAGKTIKASVVVSQQLNIRWAACAAIAGVDKGHFAADAIEAACRGLIIIDKRDKGKSSHPGSNNDRLDGASLISPDAEEAA